MGIFSRIANLFRGFASLFIKEIEKDNPEIAYENAIHERTQQYMKLKEAAAAIIRRRDQIIADKEAANNEARSIDKQLQAAVKTKNRQLGTVLLQKKKSVQDKLERLVVEEDRVIKQADDVKASLQEVQASIHSLKEEKDDMLARDASAEARQAIQEQLDGISLDTTTQTLETVRESIKNKEAAANLNDELGETDIDRQLSKLRKDADVMTAESEFEALMAAEESQEEFVEAIAESAKRGHL